MTDEMSAIRDDLAFMRALALEGRRAPLLGGGILALAGGVFAAASLVHWAVLSGLLNGGWLLVNGAWFGAFAVFMLGLFLLKNRVAAQPGARAPSNKAVGAAWSAIGISIFCIGLVLLVTAARLDEPRLVNLFAPLILSLYGAVWSVAAFLFGRPWMTGMAASAFGWSLGLAFTIGSPEQYLAYAAALVWLALLPGLWLMRQEPSEVV